MNVASMRFYSDNELRITLALKHIFQNLCTKGESAMGISENPTGDGINVNVE